MKHTQLTLALAAVLGLAASANAAFVIEVDLDPVDGPLVLGPNFSLGGDTTTVSDSIPSVALGVTGGSVFGGDGGALPDTYIHSYTPSVDGANRTFTAGDALNDDGDVSTGIAAGASGEYNIYATWPITNSVSGGPTLYEIADSNGVLFDITIDQNTVNGFVDLSNGQTFAGGEWVLLGTATLDASETYTVTQTPTLANSFVSMRSGGVLFEPAIPEPTSGLLAALGLVGLAVRRR